MKPMKAKVEALESCVPSIDNSGSSDLVLQTRKEDIRSLYVGIFSFSVLFKIKNCKS